MKTLIGPTIMVAYGVTGDLMARKILPALYQLKKKQILPDDFQLIGFARRPIGTKGFRKMMLEAALKHKIKKSDPVLKSLLGVFTYHEGNFNDQAAYDGLKTIVDEISLFDKRKVNLLHYLAVPPALYETIFLSLGRAKLNRQHREEGWTRLVIEKPFGNDYKTAKKLETTIRKFFHEEQIFRIDHYLGKAMLQNIIAFRFSNNLFETNWGNKLIEKIEIFLHESIGLEDRGEFYDSVGALRDVGQNHLLQMLALVTMSNPRILNADSVRASRAKLLQSLKQMSLNDVKNKTFRGQFRGYLESNEVSNKSKTETFFRIETQIASKNWRNVPIILEGGKNLPTNKKEIVLTFRHPMPCACPSGIHYKNRLIFSLDPETISIEFWLKKPGLKMEMEKRSFDLTYRQAGQGEPTGEYEKLLYDCFTFDQLLFVNTEEVLAMWKFIDPIVKTWSKGLPRLIKYQPKTYPIKSQKRTNNKKSSLIGA